MGFDIGVSPALTGWLGWLQRPLTGPAEGGEWGGLTFASWIQGSNVLLSGSRGARNGAVRRMLYRKGEDVFI